ncbi:hypothetical protein E0Z10_g6416 [Xylaria hypoxylon]|uniref:non-specific serine/threonine protein kinase n=1 Tax=Xylaria hypoxylon TaxID=37992 RepID=A0A4Z0YDN2_9PEZI|nr:hypothetical protein E0Z10_g6416 [Xylaria hypoxylon]
MSISPPPTPSRGLNRDELRFESITSPCEWIEQYHPGGYHPVHLGDAFSHGRYKVLRKLGEGAYSTVWLARDVREDRYVALKIIIADFPQSTDELRILHHISQVAPAEAPRYVTQLLDSFDHPGPNGLHKCLVFEPMGPTVNIMVEELPQFKPRTIYMDLRYPLEMARPILKQSLEALAFLHDNGIAHGDFQPGNILFSLDNIDSKTEDSLRQEESEEDHSISPPVRRLDGKEDRWAPRYLCLGQPLTAFTSYANELKVKLSDMGGAYFFADPPAKPITPAGLRAPELILTRSMNNTLDVWSFGCILFEIVTGRPLFCVPWYKSQVMMNDDHLLQLNACLGPFPDDLYEHWENSSFYFTPERKLYNCALGDAKERVEPLMLPQQSMEELFDEAKPDIDEEEASEIKLLIRRILQYDPANRPSAAEILEDPWFRRANLEPAHRGENPEDEAL